MRRQTYSYSPAAGFLALLIGSALEFAGAASLLIPAQAILEQQAVPARQSPDEALTSTAQWAGIEAAFFIIKIPISVALFSLGWWFLLFGVVRLAVQPLINQNDILLRLPR